MTTPQPPAGPGDEMWRAVGGRTGGKPPAGPRDALESLTSAGVTKKEIAEQLGVSVRTVERWMTAGAERRNPTRSKHAAGLTALARNHSKVRQQARSGRRAARMRNKGARVRIKGSQGPRVGKSWRVRHRTVTEEIDPYSMEKILDAWDQGDDDAALQALQDALEDHGYPPGWEWEGGADVDFLGLSRE